MVSSEDLQSSLAQFEREIQEVKTAPSDPNENQLVSSSSPPITVPKLESSTTSSQPAGRWKWIGDSWKWEGASHPISEEPHTPATLPAISATPTVPVSALDSGTTSNMHRPQTRTAAGTTWRDPTLLDWPDADYRLFVGDLAPDTTDIELENAFRHYASFNMARTVRDKRTDVCRGYGFVSFGKGEDMVAALREMNGKYVGARPIKLKKSNWQKKNLTSERRKQLKLFRRISKP